MALLFAFKILYFIVCIEDFIFIARESFSFHCPEKDNCIETRKLPLAEYDIPLRRNWVMYLKHDLLRWFAALQMELIFCPAQQKICTRFYRAKAAEGHQGIFRKELSYLVGNTLNPQKYFYKVSNTLL